MPSPATERRLARLLILGLGATRLLQGVVEVTAPHWFLARIGVPNSPVEVQLGFRMKGGRDVTLGLLTVLARHDDDELATMAIGAAVLDVVDGAVIALDGGRTMGRPAYPAGAVLAGLVAGAAWWAHQALRR